MIMNNANPFRNIVAAACDISVEYSARTPEHRVVKPVLRNSTLCYIIAVNIDDL